MQKFNGTLRGTRSLAVSAALALASAAFGGITGDPLTVTATSSAGTASFSLNILDGSWNGDNTVWTYNGPVGQVVQMIDPGNLNVVAELDLGGFSVSFVFDPEVNVNFTATAGVAATAFSFSSALLSFPSIPGATATASAGWTLQDRNGNGATMTGSLNAASAGYRADYNGLVPAGTQYAAALASLNAPAFGNNNSNANFGPDLIGTVSSMSAAWGFTLSARDAATGTSSFVIAPAPGTVAALGMLGLATLGRRRR